MNGTPVPRAELAVHEEIKASARAALGDEGFARAWAAGRALSVDEAIAETPSERESAPEAAPAPVRLVSARPAGPLSSREYEVATLIAQGRTNRQIAQQLVISEWTVDTHIRHILTKLDFRSRAQVAAWTMEQGLVAKGATQA